MIVLDASVIVAFLLDSPPHADQIRHRLLDPDQSLHSPHLLDVEVAQVLRRFVRREETMPERAAAALTDLRDLDVIRYPHDLLLGRIWELRENLSAYDGAYVALAELLEAPLLTLDAALARAPGHRAEVELIPGR